MGMTRIAALCALLAAAEAQQSIVPVTTATSTGKPGYTTYQVSVQFTNARDVYALFGEPGDPMTFPPAFQVATPFGTDVGPVNPAFFAVMPEAQFDSFLTIGLDGPSSIPGALASIGIGCH